MNKLFIIQLSIVTYINILYSQAPKPNVELIGNFQVITAIGDSSIFIGKDAGLSDDGTDNENLFIGIQSGKANVNGNDNTFLGHGSGFSNTIGNDNTFLGRAAGELNIMASDNTFVGRSAGRTNTTGSSNTFLGRSAGSLNIGGSDNTFLGRSAGSANTNGRDNTFIGRGAGQGNTSADDNTFVGRLAGSRHRTGNNNTFIGEGAGKSDSLGSENTIIGANADVLNFNLTNSAAFGYNAKVSASNSIVIGNISITSIGGYSSWSVLSDGRFKYNIKENVPGLDFIMKLRPVTYQIDKDKLNQFLNPKSKVSVIKNERVENRQVGLIAQEVYNLCQKESYDFSGVVTPQGEHDHFKIKYEEFVLPLIKAIQEQQILLKKLENEIASLKKEK